jgi:catechol 2,3-dioxygenase-like lactoylglutathione lyase family enzyme
MLDHLDIGATDLHASGRFFIAALAPLGLTVLTQGQHGIGLGSDGRSCLFLAPARSAPSPIHIAFTARNRAEVDAFHQAALTAGGSDNGAPGLRPHYHPTYYAAFVIAPDGHNVEAVCHGAED